MYVQGVSGNEFERMLYRELKKERPLIMELSMADYDVVGNRSYEEVFFKFISELGRQGVLNLQTMEHYLRSNYGFTQSPSINRENDSWIKPNVIVE